MQVLFLYNNYDKGVKDLNHDSERCKKKRKREGKIKVA